MYDATSYATKGKGLNHIGEFLANNVMGHTQLQDVLPEEIAQTLTKIPDYGLGGIFTPLTGRGIKGPLNVFNFKPSALTGASMTEGKAANTLTEMGTRARNLRDFTLKAGYYDALRDAGILPPRPSPA